ncbi:MAG: hypothetical protein A3I39_02115 [Candidatus Yanofskybacteria bacterium RIFCSPLOWO2_02_FULL_47_9b]|uniref:Fimbrial assembly protein n=1 Tax=Candidatus Yanofskybacteria bacterium RIFCSPLOWO2_02_FULL_47_9b TaxID=1802708 RepID=A0A1F8H687_9BACT|nr:MAG: hypothetical protein A3I39_02115 [Candidatus Yanofskybacteria bacterium RIFCSPLOWO2_02_FULL_47_9b]
MTDKGGLQLLPENRRRIDVKVPGQNRPVTLSVVVLVLVIVIYGILSWYSSSLDTKIADADSRLASIDQQRDKTSENNLLILSKQMAITGQIINNHTFWSTAFSKLESGLAGSVQFKSFSAVASDNTLHIRALTDTYATIARQLAAFAGTDGVADVNLDGVSTLTSGKLDFNVKLIFDPTKFLKKP